MSAIIRIAKNYPIRFGMGYSLFKTSGCDLMVQKVVEKREHIDWRRNAAFGTFGLLYLGGVQYMIYVPLFSRLFPNAASFAAKSVGEKLRDGPGLRNLVSQVFLDQGVHHPLLYFPVFYMIKDFVTSPKPDPVQAVKEYGGNMREDLIALWKVWIPSTFLNFAFMPMWARIPWVASTSLIWTCILSAMRGSSDVPAAAVEGGGGVDAQTMRLVTRPLIGPAPRLDPSHAHLLVSVSGPDRPGIVAELTHELCQYQGSITTSKMMSLGQEFAITMHVEAPIDNVGALRAALSRGKLISEYALDVHTRQVPPLTAGWKQPSFSANINLQGIDRPGLVYKLATVLTDEGLDIEHLQTEQHRQRSDRPRMFTTECQVCSSMRPDMPKLRKELKRLEAELDVVCTLEVTESLLHRSVTH